MTALQSSAGALIVDRNTWTARANQAWGPSDVWNSGNSWEYLTGYHGWVGRTYNVGESWEAAYNRVYTDRYNAGYSAGYTAGDAAGRAAVMPSGSGQTPAIISQAFTFTTGESIKVTVNATVTGYWALRCYVPIAATAQSQDWVMRVLVAGGVRITSAFKPNSGTTMVHSLVHHEVVAAGTAFQVSGIAFGDGISDRAGTFECMFVPTPTYPH